MAKIQIKATRDYKGNLQCWHTYLDSYMEFTNWQAFASRFTLSFPPAHKVVRKLRTLALFAASMMLLSSITFIFTGWLAFPLPTGNTGLDAARGLGMIFLHVIGSISFVVWLATHSGLQKSR